MAISKQDLQRIIFSIPAHRWFLISQRLDMPTDFIMQDFIAQMVVVGNERARDAAAAAGERVTDDFARFLNMGFIELSKASGLIDEDTDPYADDDDQGAADEEPAGDDDPKSSGAVEPAGDVLAGTGEVLPDHGTDT